MVERPRTKHQSNRDLSTVAATSLPPPANTKKCHFFKLPPELRIIIYSDVISDVDFIQDQGLEPRIVRPPILNTCRAIQHESVQLYKYRLGTMLAECANAATKTVLECTAIVQTARATEPSQREVRIHFVRPANRHTKKTIKHFISCYKLGEQEMQYLKQTYRLIAQDRRSENNKDVVFLKTAHNDLRTACEAYMEAVNF